MTTSDLRQKLKVAKKIAEPEERAATLERLSWELFHNWREERDRANRIHKSPLPGANVQRLKAEIAAHQQRIAEIAERRNFYEQSAKQWKKEAARERELAEGIDPLQKTISGFIVNLVREAIAKGGYFTSEDVAALIAESIGDVCSTPDDLARVFVGLACGNTVAEAGKEIDGIPVPPVPSFGLVWRDNRLALFGGKTVADWIRWWQSTQGGEE